MLCKAYVTSYKMPIIITRGNNVYGPHQFPEKVWDKHFMLWISLGSSSKREIPCVELVDVSLRALASPYPFLFLDDPQVHDLGIEGAGPSPAW